ncbi:MAG: Hsp70 family protein [Pirellulales bacterium]|nr:Hsp70 family protein [Pirellulales bacterium]
MADTAIGIDLGTTYSVAAHLDNQGHPWTLPNAEGDRTTPSVVFFDTDGPTVGKEAVKAAAFEPDRVAHCVKRNMGDRVYERPICGHALPPEIIQALILRKVKQDAELKLGSVREAVITVPAYFNEPRRKATQDAGRLAGLDVLDIINEPTAAAIAFGVGQGFLDPLGGSAQPETILVYDLGGGTFDVTVMEIDNHHYKALATAGDVHLGGIDWDMRIVDHVAGRFMEECGTDPRNDARALQALLLEASDAKHALSIREKITIHFAWDGHRIRFPLTRPEFESLTSDLMDRTLLTTRKVLRESKLNWTNLTRLLLVGGSTRMPMIPRMLEQESGLVADRSLAPDEAVAHGAAIYAGLLAGRDFPSRDQMSVANVNSHDLGVLGIEPESGRRRKKVLIPRNTRLPAKRSALFATRRDGQPNVLVTVIEGGDRTGDHATHIGQCIVTDLPSNLPARTPVQVHFHYTPDGRLTITASIPGTGCDATTDIERFSGLSEEMITEWMKRIENGTVLEPHDQSQACQLDPLPRDHCKNPADNRDSLATHSLESSSDAPIPEESMDMAFLPDFADDAPSVDIKALNQLNAVIKNHQQKVNPSDDTALEEFLKKLDTI